MPFKAFLGKNIKLIAPQKGMVSIVKSSDLQFLLQNVPPNTEVVHHFKKEKYGQKVKSYSKADMLGFTIFPNAKGKDELIIYFNEVPALGYQVNVK